jgi:hypothetical protein
MKAGRIDLSSAHGDALNRMRGPTGQRDERNKTNEQ